LGFIVLVADRTSARPIERLTPKGEFWTAY